MNIEEATTIQNEFQALTYAEKLNYWDEKGISFTYDYHQIEESVRITIKPNQGTDQLIYNKWIVDHWRRRFFTNLPPLTSSSLLILKSFQDYVKAYEQQLANKQKEEVFESEIPRVSAQILSFKVKRPILTMVYYNVNNSLEEDIYKFQSGETSTFVELKQIAQVLDLIKYLVFLKREKRNYKQSEQPPTKGYFASTTQSRIEVLYDELITHRFIDKGTDKSNFIKLLNNDKVDDDFSITWIDFAPKSKVGNKLTLLALAYDITTVQVQEINSIIVSYFKVMTGGQIKRITRQALKSSWSRFNSQGTKKQERQELITKIIEKAYR
jgi:hypothetical protein